MRIFRMAYVMLMLILAACGGQPQQQGDADSRQTSRESRKTPFPVFSLFDSTGRDGYQLYRNGNRHATVKVDSNCCIRNMRAYKDDCFILVSARSADAMQPSVILKNGRPAMTFDSSFMACDLVIDDGHFVVMGYDVNTHDVMVYRDGQEALTISHTHHWGTPSRVGEYQKDVYVAFQKGDTVLVTRGGYKISTFPGKCVDFEVSHMGYYTLADSALYRDTERIMQHEYFRSGSKEVFADPLSISVTRNNCYVCSRSTFDDKRYYGVVFRNREVFFVIKPDDKLLGESDMETVCAGVAASGDDNYTAYYKVDADKNHLVPVVFYYKYNTDDCFNIDFGSNKPRLLYMETSR